MIPSETPVRVGLVLAVVGSLVLVRWLDGATDWGPRLRSRLLLGVPWGTLVSMALVTGVYLFVQSGWGAFERPVTIPFRSWSYFYPIGTIVAPFAHHGPGHLAGNLIGAAVLGTLAEYTWGHYPRQRGASTFSSASTNPYVRAFIAFPAGVIAVGLLTSIFSWGPVIGFSGVVFAFAGFSLVRYPLGTVIALAADDVVRITYRALRDPVLVQRAQPEFVTPWWAGIAIQGHLLGLTIGLALGALVVYRTRERPPDALRIWAGALIAATSVSLWAIWWSRGGTEFVLFRGLGAAFVLVLSALITLGVRSAADRRRVPWLNVSGRQIAMLVLVFPGLVVAGAAVPLNLVTVADAGLPGGGPAVEVDDYAVVYAENVTNGQTAIVNVSFLGETTALETSGVIVVSQRRHVWSRVVSTSRLAFAGNATVRLGGVGWAVPVTAERRGWTVAGEGTAYAVWLTPPGGASVQAYRSPPAVADPVIRGRRVAVEPVETGFRLAVQRANETIDAGPVPARNASATIGGLRVVREADDDLYVEAGNTRVRIARQERYPGAQTIR